MAEVTVKRTGFTDVQKDEFRTETGHKKEYKLTFADSTLAYDGSNISEDGIEITESLCSADNLSFSSVEIPTLSFTLINIDQNIKDLKEKKFSMEMTVSGVVTVPMGTWTITEATRNNDDLMEVKAEGQIRAFAKDVTTWWTSTVTVPITLRDLLISLCDYVGVDYSIPEKFTNSGMVITKKGVTGSGEAITGIDMLGYIQEAAAHFFAMPRLYNNGTVLTIVEFDDLYPSEMLFPSDTLYPGKGSAKETYTGSVFTGDVDIADYTTAAIERVQIKGSANDVGAIVGTGSNTYIIESNPLFFIFGAEDLEKYATNILAQVKTLTYVPVTANVKGLPYLIPGDKVNIHTPEGHKVETRLLCRTLSGAQDYSDVVTIKGDKDREKVTNQNKTLKVVNRRIHEVISNVDTLSSTISNVQEEVKGNTDKITENSTKIEQTATDISTVAKSVETVSEKVEKDSDRITSNENGLSAANDKITELTTKTTENETSIKQNAEAIKLKASQDTVTEIQAELNKKVSKLGLYPAETRYPGETLYPEGDFSEYTTHREVTAEIAVESDKITSKVEETYEKQIDAQKTKEELSSTITQTAAGIESKVEKKVDSDEYTGDTIVSKINQTAEEVKIEASHVAINGLLTITNSDGTKSITVPTKTSQLTNDSIKVPTKTSELTNDSGYLTSVDEDVYVTYADLAAKKAQASDYTEINGAKITTGEIDAVDIYSSSLTFGDTSNSYVEMRTNDAKTGGIIEGSGVIEFKTKGKFNAENQSTSGGNSASIIRMANDTVTVTNLDKASATNNRNYINLMNYLTTKASSEDSAYYSDLANSIYVTGNSEPSKGNTMKLQNYYYTDPAYIGNIIDIESSKHLDGTTKYDYNSIQMKNYYPGSSIYANGIFLWNNAYDSTDGFTGAKIALRNFNSSGKKENEIYLLERSGNPKILISNNNASEKAVNDIELNYNSGAPTLVISNRSAASVLCNQIDMEARTGNGNIFWYYNYDYSENDGKTKANQMYIWSNTSGSNQAVIQNFSGGSEKNLLALYSSGTYGVVLKNIASTGKTSQLYFQNDGKIRLETNTGGTSFIQVSTNGNMDVQANNALVLKSENAYVTMQTVSAKESGHIHRWHYKLGWCSVKGTDGNTYQALVGYESA